MVGSMEHRFLLIKSWAGVANESTGVSLYSSKLMYGSLLSTLAFFKNCFAVCTDFSTRPLDWGTWDC